MYRKFRKALIALVGFGVLIVVFCAFFVCSTGGLPMPPDFYSPSCGCTGWSVSLSGSPDNSADHNRTYVCLGVPHIPK